MGTKPRLRRTAYKYRLGAILLYIVIDICWLGGFGLKGPIYLIHLVALGFGGNCFSVLNELVEGFSPVGPLAV